MNIPDNSAPSKKQQPPWLVPTIGFVLMFAIAIGISLAKGRDIHWGGLIAMIVFYAVTFYVGFAGADVTGSSLEQMIVADRSLPLWIGTFTMAATWIDGGYINGTAEFTSHFHFELYFRIFGSSPPSMFV